MNCPATNVAVLGSTGSIGCSTLEVIAGSAGRMRVKGLTAHSRQAELFEQARRLRPSWVVVTDARDTSRQAWQSLGPETRVLFGPDAVDELVRDPAVDTVVAAIVGSAGLRGAWAAVDAGKRLALANKETLVMAGPLVMELAAQRSATLLPVDSEHSAIFQAMASGRRDQVKRVLLTASGGPFRRFTRQQMAEVTVEQALAHPTWNMGPKITVDSATMMNKALEIVEARWLFDLRPEQIEVVIHPQSIVHSLVEFVDGSVVAQLSPPDMKLPIQYALTYPDRVAGVARRMNWREAFTLEFEPPDEERFPALRLGFEVARAGGTTGAVVNGANEAAVQAFLEGRLRFHQIVEACQAVLEHHDFDPRPTLSDLLRLDQWARQEVSRWLKV